MLSPSIKDMGVRELRVTQPNHPRVGFGGWRELTGGKMMPLVG